MRANVTTGICVFAMVAMISVQASSAIGDSTMLLALYPDLAAPLGG